MKDIPELVSIQSYAGTAAPFNFNGLVRHYYMRAAPELGDLAINLQPKSERSRASHAIALDIRKKLEGLPAPEHTAIKVVEVPPGPPVLSTLLAEVYGPDAQSRRDLAARVRKAFDAVDFVVDTDDSYGQRAERLRFEIDQEALEYHGVEERAVYDTIAALVGGVKIGFSRKRAAGQAGLYRRCLGMAMTPSERILSTPLPAGGRRVKARMWNSATSSRRRVNSAPTRSSVTTAALRRNGQRRGRRAFRSADLRDARG
ncbi:MAG: hypothetical protein U1E25_13545 [Methylocystis sp.]